MFRQNNYVLFLILFFSVSLHAQSKYNTGLLFDESKYDSLALIPEFEGSKSDDLPLSFSLKVENLRITNQGQIGSCVGHSLANAMTISYGNMMGWNDREMNENAFSVLFAYNILTILKYKFDNCNQGSYIEDACRIANSMGIPPYKDFDQQLKTIENCFATPNKSALKKALNFRTKEHNRLFPRGAKEGLKKYQVKRALANGKPVIIGLLIEPNFYDTNKENKTWKPNYSSTDFGGHAMVVVGYDDRKQAFLLMNSWGKEWGDNGYGWVKYKDFTRYCDYAYIIVVDKNVEEVEDEVIEVVEEEVVEDKVIEVEDEVVEVVEDEVIEVVEDDVVEPKLMLSGRFDLKEPVFDENEEMSFNDAKATYLGGYTYGLSKKDWEIGDMFQLAASKIQKDSYVYVFSVDEEGENYHWPRQSGLAAKKFMKMHEGAIVPFGNVRIVIPGPERALIRRTEGTDHIVILYSSQRIDNLSERVDQLMKASGSFEERFQASFNDILIPVADIDYMDNLMMYTCKTNSDGTLIPIILTVEGE